MHVRNEWRVPLPETNQSAPLGWDVLNAPWLGRP
jgi:hypothetical protein